MEIYLSRTAWENFKTEKKRNRRLICVTNYLSLLRDRRGAFSRKQGLPKRREQTNMASTRKAVHLFNCDKLCNLSEVEVLLKVVEKKVSFKISPIKKHQFRREQIANMVDQTIPKLKTVDYAVFVVHAGEGCLSFNEDNGYGKIYEALKKRTGSGKGKVHVTGNEQFSFLGLLRLGKVYLGGIPNPYIHEVSRKLLASFCHPVRQLND